MPESNDNEPETLTLRPMAARLLSGVRRLRQLAEAGEVPGTCKGGRWVFPVVETIDAYFAYREQKKANAKRSV